MKPVSHRILLSLLLAGMTLPGWAWDDSWTQGRSGRGDAIYDPWDSTGNSGQKERPQTFFIPPTPDYVDVDPQELSDYKKKDYSPYALARITQNLVYRGMVIPKGYYLIQPGNAGSGSPRVKMQATQQLPSMAQTANGQASSPTEPTDPKNPVYQVFVLKRLGKVVAVIPIHRSESYQPAGKTKPPKQALAWLDTESNHPVLKFYYKKQIYTADFE